MPNPPHGCKRTGVVLVRLREVYTAEGCGVWLYAKHERWGGKTGVQMLAEGRFAALEAAIEGMRSGAPS